MARRSKDDAASGSHEPFVVKFEPRSESQQKVLEAYPRCDVLFITGPAGCGKTMAAVGAAMQDIQASRGRKSLLVLRPAVEAGKTLGYLPGGVDEKIMPYMGSFTQALKKVAFNLPPGFTRFEALGFQRGMTYEDCIVCADEMQNATYAQIVMLLTRLGRNSKILVLGDPDQADIRSTVPDYDVDLDAAVDALTGLARVGLVEFSQQESLRHPLIAKMLRRLNALRS